MKNRKSYQMLVAGVLLALMGSFPTPVYAATTESKTVNVKIVVAQSSMKKLDVPQIDDAKISWNVANRSIAAVDKNGNIKGLRTGTTEIIGEVEDNTVVTGEVVITNPALASSKGILAKKKTTTVAVKGLNEDSSISVNADGSRVSASVKNGKLTIYPKKMGTTNIKVTMDGKVSNYKAVITSAQAVKAISKAQAAKGSRYSQPKRMRKGYYDCSSLIWRCYKTTGIYFGNRRTAPVAASEAKYMKRHKKVVSYKRVKESKLLPGDIIFYSYHRNARYRNITHVALYIGNGKVIHAKGRKYGVVESQYVYSKSIRMIARPVKS